MGGTLSTGGLLSAVEDLSGVGVINTGGLVSDVNLVFDATHGLSQTLVLNEFPGQDLTINLSIDGTGYMGAGYGGAGTMLIADGVEVASTLGQIGYHSGSTGRVTVDGAASTWTMSGDPNLGYYGFLWVGRQGSGSLLISAGGSVSNPTGYIGDQPGSSGEVTVDGVGSTWTNSGNLYVGDNGDGKLTISSGGGVGSSSGHIGSRTGSTGLATVDGVGSTWINSSNLYVGNYGEGKLSIIAGGSVSNSGGYIGSPPGSTGQVMVDGVGSTWTNSGNLYVGDNGDGNVTISEGGLVSIARTLEIDGNSNGTGFIHLATGGMLALFGDAGDSIAEFLGRVQGTDAIRYWDHDLLVWSHITSGTLSEDYTLEYLTTGDLMGYTLLTVGSLADLPNLPGDFNGDGTVDSADYTVWRDNLGTNVSLPNEATTFGQVTEEDYETWRASFGAIANALPGDFNADGIVDAADYTVWRDTLGSTGLGLAADANDDEVVDSFDYGIWRSNFGQTISSITVDCVAVPEPTGLCLLNLGLLVALVQFRRRNLAR